MTAGSTINPIPLPAGAVRVEPWYHPDKPISVPSNGEPGSLRYFTGTKRTVPRNDPDTIINIEIDGNQYAGGQIERFILLDGDPITAVQAREVAKALMAAADETDLLAGHDEGLQAR